jgi:hypothetical protein
MKPKTVEEILAMPKDATVNGFHGKILDMQEPFQPTEHDKKRGRIVQLILVTDMGDSGGKSLVVSLEDPAHHLDRCAIGAEIGLEANNGERGITGLVVNRFTPKGGGDEKVRLVVTKNGGGRVVIPSIQETVQRPAEASPTPNHRKTKTRAIAEHLEYCVRLIDWTEDDDLRQRYATTLFIQTARDCLGDADRDPSGQLNALDAEIEGERQTELAKKLAEPAPETEMTVTSDGDRMRVAAPKPDPEPDIDTAFATLMLTEPFHGLGKDSIMAAICAMESDMDGNDPALKRARVKREILLKPDVFAELVEVMATPEDSAPPSDLDSLLGEPRGPQAAEFSALCSLALQKHSEMAISLAFADLVDESLGEEEGYLAGVAAALADPEDFISQVEDYDDDIPF